jgi:putative ABC transport system permease protein
VFFVYLRRELRRRPRQAIGICLGLALGVGLVITVTAASDGVKDAQGTVLHALYGVGTDITVTQPGVQGTGRPARFEIRSSIRDSFQGSLAAGRPATGTHFSKSLLISSASGLGTLRAASVATVARLPGVSAAGGALALADLRVSGTIPAPGSRATGAASSISTSSFSVLGTGVAGQAGPLSSARLTAGRTFRDADTRASVAMLDANYARQHGLKPGSTVTVGDSQGHGSGFRVIGVVQAPPGAAPADVYIPLARAQALAAAPQAGASLAGKVNTIYVTAGSAASIGAIQREIGRLLPSATVVTAGDLAGEVTGSLASASTLASSLGTWLAAAALLAAFLLASLLTMAAVSRRVREFGTLKALGWRSRRIVGQVMGETLTMGIAGGLAGIALGLGGAALVGRLAPALTATVGPAVGSAAPAAGRQGRGLLRSLGAGVPSVSVHLTAPVTAGIAVAAVLLALAGGLIAGALGGWRIARLRPAPALARVE